ncbi:hypothetical protein QR680_006234 [Steinernema hermaphroditum]|uniref:Saposin B-type domain-containing protein n=1 Tax=Steinernema hermaphroditum TaxID=289476 RepID=A0AA39HUS0_9BILA|nr:hypothetical protein QR680_006234 [Steinernema hermaphroditum]
MIIRTVVFCAVLISAANPLFSDDVQCEHNHEIQNVRFAFRKISNKTCFNSTIPCAVCGMELMNTLTKRPTATHAIAKCGQHASFMLGAVLQECIDRCADESGDAKKMHSISKRSVQETSQKKVDDLMHYQVINFNVPLYGYMNTINVTNLEKFLKMQIDIKAQKDVDKLRESLKHK